MIHYAWIRIEKIQGLDYINMIMWLFLKTNVKEDINVKLALDSNQMSRKQGIELAIWRK